VPESQLIHKLTHSVANATLIVAERAERIGARRESLARLGIDAVFVTDGAELVRHLAEDWSIEVVLLDLALATPELLSRLTGMGETGSGPSVVAIADAASADVAGVALSTNITAFLGVHAGDAELESALTSAAHGNDYAVADRGDYGLASIGALSREVDRIATALSSLARAQIELPEGDGVVSSAHVRALIKARRMRERYFPAEMFSDPAWDMLLDLTAARLDDQPVSVSSLCIASAVPTTTALRWIRNLCDAGIFERCVDPGDARRAFIALSASTFEAMKAYLEANLKTCALG
jgi:CheY-like chemotaxis protein